MNDVSEPAPTARTWRDIPQQVKPRAMSHEGRRRLVLAGAKTAGAAVVLMTLAWGVYEMISAWREEPGKIATAVNTVPIKELALVTDGVLDRAWLTGTLALPATATLMQLDIYRLQARLLASGQVRSATLTKVFPATLTVKLAERSPVARVRAQAGDGTPHEFLVARDGVVYDGVGYEAAMTAALPWLDGVALIRQGRGFAPLAGMATVADLLAKARNEAPQLYRTWQVVNLARLADDGEIEVRSSEIARIIFSTELDFFTQLTRLDYARDQAGPPMKMINLGLGPQVVVSYDETTAPVPRPVPDAPRLSVTRPVVPAFPDLQMSRHSNRDL